MKDIIKSIEDAQMKPEVPDSFRVGDTVRVSAKVSRKVHRESNPGIRRNCY